MFGGFTARPNFGNQLFPSRTLGQFGNQATQMAANFLNATQISDPTIVSAINQLVADLFFYGLITKIRALYPFVGGTAALHKFNLIDPRDLDIAFRLNFVGGWTHSATGATPNGTNAYADTFIVPNIVLFQNDVSMGLYSGTDVTSATVAMGSNFTNTIFLRIYPRHPGNLFFFDMNDASVGALTNTDGRGFLFGTRLLSNQKKGSIRGTITAATANTVGLGTPTIYLGAQNLNGSPNLYSVYQHRLSFVGRGLTDTEAANLHTAVQAFQTTLGRQFP
jgi:hypothetical protein